ncbi:MAG: ParB/RepB/Spo0J family partition protein [Planctomycetota bacterium]
MAQQGSGSSTGRASRRGPKLGRGLSALVGPGAPLRVGAEPEGAPAGLEQNTNIISGTPTHDVITNNMFAMVPVDSVMPNPHQPRRVFDEAALESLAASIRADGVMQPIVVRRAGDAFELVAGERRLRASRLAGLAEVPAIIREVDDRTSAELALIENLQRADLNPVERARAFRALLDRHGLTQAQLGSRLGMDRASVTNHLRLLDLGEEILDMIATGSLGFAHGRALAGVSNLAARQRLAESAAEESWSARRLERAVAEHAGGGGERSETGGAAPTDEGPKPEEPSRARVVLDDMEKRLGEHLGTRVALKTDASGRRGTVTISFFTLDEFDGILDRLGYRPGSA